MGHGITFGYWTEFDEQLFECVDLWQHIEHIVTRTYFPLYFDFFQQFFMHNSVVVWIWSHFEYKIRYVSEAEGAVPACIKQTHKNANK